MGTNARDKLRWPSNSILDCSKKIHGSNQSTGIRAQADEIKFMAANLEQAEVRMVCYSIVPCDKRYSMITFSLRSKESS